MAKKTKSKNSMAKKVVAWVAIVILALNLVAVAAKWISQLYFWIILIAVSALAFLILYFLKKD